MIPPPFKHRFKGDSGVDIATQEIDVAFPDGEKRRVVLRVGAPFLQEGIWRIRSELENLDRTDGPLAGSEAFDALINGVGWIPARMRIFSEKHGCTYHWPNSSEIFDCLDYFDPLKFVKKNED